MVSDHSGIDFPLSDGSFRLVAVVQSFVFKAWFRRREYADDRLDKVSCDNFHEEMLGWLNFHKDHGDIRDFDLKYDKSVWPVGRLHDLYTNRLVLHIETMKSSQYVFDVRLPLSLFGCISSVDPDSEYNVFESFNIFDVTFDVDHVDTPRHVRRKVKC